MELFWHGDRPLGRVINYDWNEKGFPLGHVAGALDR
jgi:hypothetical protein